MFIELAPGVRFRIVGKHINLLRYLSQRKISDKVEDKFPDLEIIIDSAALGHLASEVAVEDLQKEIANLGVFSHISFRFKCKRNQPLSDLEIQCLQNLLVKLPQNMRCEKVSIEFPSDQIYLVGILSLIEVLKNVRSLYGLDISGSHMPPLEIAKRSGIFKELAKLQSINFANCEGFDDAYLEEVSKAEPKLRAINIFGANLKNLESLKILFQHFCLEKLDISRTHLVSLNPQDFCELIAKDKTLTSLSLAHCALPNVVTLAVIDRINDKSSNLRAINFSGNVISLEAAQGIAVALKTNRLDELRIGECRVENEAIAEIIRGIAQSRSLRVLDLSGVSLAADFENFFNAILRKNIEELSLNHCEISEENLTKLLAMPVKILNVKYANFDFREESLEMLSRNLTLQFLNLNYSFAPHADKVKVFEAALVCNMVREDLGVKDLLDVSGIRAVEISPERLVELGSEAKNIATKIRADKDAGFSVSPVAVSKIDGLEKAFEGNHEF